MKRQSRYLPAAAEVTIRAMADEKTFMFTMDVLDSNSGVDVEIVVL